MYPSHAVLMLDGEKRLLFCAGVPDRSIVQLACSTGATTGEAAGLQGTDNGRSICDGTADSESSSAGAVGSGSRDVTSV
jgi:hypothetical protein